MDTLILSLNSDQGAKLRHIHASIHSTLTPVWADRRFIISVHLSILLGQTIFKFLWRLSFPSLWPLRLPADFLRPGFLMQGIGEVLTLHESGLSGGRYHRQFRRYLSAGAPLKGTEMVGGHTWLNFVALWLRHGFGH